VVRLKGFELPTLSSDNTFLYQQLTEFIQNMIQSVIALRTDVRVRTTDRCEGRFTSLSDDSKSVISRKGHI
jgi:hypothetical protein